MLSIFYGLSSNNNKPEWICAIKAVKDVRKMHCAHFNAIFTMSSSIWEKLSPLYGSSLNVWLPVGVQLSRTTQTQVAVKKKKNKINMSAESFSPEVVKYKMLLSSMLWSSLTPPAGRYRFHEDVDNMVQVLEAPLWGGKASLVLLLPFHVENLARLDKLLTPELLSRWLERTAVTGVALSLPKANITSSLSLQVGAPMLAVWQFSQFSDGAVLFMNINVFIPYF